MNVKFNSEELSCLIGSEYDRIYSALKRTLGPAAEVFAERSAGHGYLQWRLPGDNWQPITLCDPSRRQALHDKVGTLKAEISQRFGANQSMAANVLSTPDDSFVYYAEDATTGKISICLVAWGYRYPDRVKSSDLNVTPTPKGATEKVTITLVRDGEPVPNHTFKLNGYQRITSDNGTFFVGHVSIGQKIDISVDDIDKEYTVAQGEGNIKVQLASMPLRQNVDTISDGKNAEKKEEKKIDEKTEEKNVDKNTHVPFLPYACIAILIVIAYIMGLKII